MTDCSRPDPFTCVTAAAVAPVDLGGSIAKFDLQLTATPREEDGKPAGITAQFPEEAERRAHVGKFYYRPPAGESWCDVILRLRSMFDHIQLQYRKERVLVVAHQVTVLCARYLLENMTEAQILAIDREKDVANCSVTTYNFAIDPEGRGGLHLRGYNYVAPIEDAGEPVTKQPDAPVSPR